MQNEQPQYTVSGTDIEEVKRRNAEAGLSYQEVLELLVKMGGKNTRMYSNTNIEEVKREIHHLN